MRSIQTKQKLRNSLFKLSFITLLIFPLLTSCKKDDVIEDVVKPVETGPVTTTNVATGLDTPWQFAFAPDGRVFFTERRGRVRVIENGQLQATPYLNLRDTIIEAGESGLTGMTVDPDFSTNHYLYFAYSYEKSKQPFVIMNKVVRYVENPSTKVATLDKVLLDNIEGYINHNLGSIHFGPDAKLYVTVGERYIPEYAQDMTKLNGKILRVNRDGSIPTDNPIPGSYVYSYGHRNPQGLAWQPGTNNLFNVEHGPSEEQGCCLDEINFIRPGKNYGWPVIRGAETQAGMETPAYHSGGATWAPALNTFITSGPWAGSMLFTGLFDESLHRAIFDPSDPTKIIKVEDYLKGSMGRLRAIAQAPDGKIYMSTSNGDGRGIAKTPEDDRIVVLNIKP